MATSNTDIYNKLIGIENRLTVLEECVKRKNKLAEFWDKVIIGVISASFAFGLSNIKSWLNIK
jgi:hypothetical protein